MSLSLGGGKSKSLEDALVKEDKLAPVMLVSASKSSNASASDSSTPIASVVQHPIMLVVAERVSAKLSRDGNVNMFEIKGSLTLTGMPSSSIFNTLEQLNFPSFTAWPLN